MTRATPPLLTAVQQDYLETILRLERRAESIQVRVTDIAGALGTKLPTVTRSIQRLTALRLVSHPSRGDVTLTEAGRKVATEIAHRHDDLVAFFTKTLKVPPNIAEMDTCQIEHGLSSITAQRLHEFMEVYAVLSAKQKSALTRFRATVSPMTERFSHLAGAKSAGWRR